MLINRITFTLTKRFVNQMSRKFTENIISSPQLEILKSKPTETEHDRLLKSIKYTPNDFIQGNLYFISGGNGYSR